MQQYNKAIIAGVAGIALVALGNMGITPDTPVGDAIGVLVTTALVYMVPNKKS